MQKINILSFFKLQVFVWVLPAVFIINNIEVSSQISKWLIKNELNLPFYFKFYINDVYSQSIVNNIKDVLLIASLLPFALVWINKNNQNKLFNQYLLTFAAFMIFIHSSVIMINSILMFGYFPGVVTATFFCLPFSFRLIKYCFQTYQFKIIQKILLLIVALVLYLPLLKTLWHIAQLNG